MRISDMKTVMVSIPIERTAAANARSVGCVLVFLNTDEGVTGESLLTTWGDKWLDLLNSIVCSLKADVLGEDPFCTERVWQKLWREIRSLGHKSLSRLGLSAIERACWDVVGKTTGQPLHHLLGACREEVPVYTSGLWLYQSVEALAADAKQLVTEGVRAMKMRIGRPRIEEDVDRVRTVREVVGPDVDLMVDANQRLNVEHAIRLGRKLEEFNLRWFEEPIPAHDVEGAARVALALETPIALGENECDRYGFRRILEIKAADVLMPDLARIGGITELLKVAHMAEAYDVPVSPHVYPEQSLQLMGSLPNGIYLEYMPWFSPLYREPIRMKDGHALLPKRPGIGFTFDPEAIERYRFEVR